MSRTFYIFVDCIDPVEGQLAPPNQFFFPFENENNVVLEGVNETNFHKIIFYNKGTPKYSGLCELEGHLSP